jgi:hypothetical protein
MIVYFIIRVVYRKRMNKFRATIQVVIAANKFKRALRRKSEEGDRAAAASADAAERGDAPAPSK